MTIEDILMILAVLAVYYVLSKWILPMLGIKT
jgi:hypothetical protein